MLVGGDLGFLSSVVVAALAVLLGPVLGFVVRRKWRRFIDRKEEIKRLLVLASEEAARVELQAAADYGYSYGYSCTYGDVTQAEKEVEVLVSAPAPSQLPTLAPIPVSRQSQYQCAVCFSPTSTRCARCKAVRYCSGKCQIVHWRQGHKDECRPYTNNDQNNNGESASHLKASRREGSESSGDGSGSEEGHFDKTVEIFAKEPKLSNGSLGIVSKGKNDVEFQHNVKHLEDEKGSYSSSKFSMSSLPTEYSASANSSASPVNASGNDSNSSDESDSLHSVDLNPVRIKSDNSDMDKCKPPLSGQAIDVGSVNIVNNQSKFKPDSINVDTNQQPSTLACLNIDAHSSLAPSTLSSGFWGGKVDHIKFRSDALNDLDPLHSKEASDSETLHPQLADPERTMIASVNAQFSKDKKVTTGNHTPMVFKVKKPSEEPASPVEVAQNGLDSRIRSSRPEISNLTCNDGSSNKCLLNSTESNLTGDDGSSNKCLLNSTELKHSSITTCNTQTAPGAGVQTVNNDAFGDSNLLSVRSRGSESTTSSSWAVKSSDLKSSSKASEVSLSSTTGRHAVQDVKSVKVDAAHGTAIRPSELGNHSYAARNSLKTSVKKVVDQLRVSKLSNDIVGNNFKGLFPYELFVKLYHWSKLELRPFGLINCGNSCYANAVLQCLAFTPPLTAYFLQGLHSKSCKKKGWCFTCEFESLLLKAKEGCSPLSPSPIISNLQNIGCHLGNGREEDAHEFLRYAIDTMQSVCLKEAATGASSSLEEETTLIGLTFGGYLRSKIECMRCGGKSERHERIMDLTVEIDGDIENLTDALRQFTHTEILDGENKYKCNRCKSYEKARKKLKVLEAPNVLTIALKRFQSGKFGKLNKMIQFPEFLNLAKYMSGTSDKSPIYQLYGVVVHVDIMNAAFSGHYVCYVKNTQNRWYKVDDSSVKPVELERVLTEGAYMLLYARCSPRAPRVIRNSTISRDPRKFKHQSCRTRSHSAGPWDASAAESSTGQTCSECSYPNHANFLPIQTILEESSDNSSSLFSEVGSNCTESSNRESTSTDDCFDHIFGDAGSYWNSPCRNSSDSDTSSSSSSPSPLYSRHSPLADYGRNASGCPETCGSCTGSMESAQDGHGFWARRPDQSADMEVSESKGRFPFLCSDSSKHCRKLVCRSCREISSRRIGRINPSDDLKSGVPFR